MIAASFDRATDVLDTPEGMSPDHVSPLSIARVKDDNDCPFVVSCWKVTAEELETINRTGRIWLLVMGHTMPPVLPMGTNPFGDE